MRRFFRERGVMIPSVLEKQPSSTAPFSSVSFTLRLCTFFHCLLHCFTLMVKSLSDILNVEGSCEDVSLFASRVCDVEPYSDVAN